MHPRNSDDGLVVPAVGRGVACTAGRPPSRQHELERAVKPVAGVRGRVHPRLATRGVDGPRPVPVREPVEPDHPPLGVPVPPRPPVAGELVGAVRLGTTRQTGRPMMGSALVDGRTGMTDQPPDVPIGHRGSMDVSTALPFPPRPRISVRYGGRDSGQECGNDGENGQTTVPLPQIREQKLGRYERPVAGHPAGLQQPRRTDRRLEPVAAPATRTRLIEPSRRAPARHGPFGQPEMGAAARRRGETNRRHEEVRRVSGVGENRPTSGFHQPARGRDAPRCDCRESYVPVSDGKRLDP